MYTPDGLGDGAGEEETTVVAVGADAVVGATVETLVGVAVSWTTATAGAVVGAAEAGGAVVGAGAGAGASESEPHATAMAAITTSAIGARRLSLMDSRMVDLLEDKCQFPVSNSWLDITRERAGQFLTRYPSV